MELFIVLNLFPKISKVKYFSPNFKGEHYYHVNIHD